jgi:hypothetical protein
VTVEMIADYLGKTPAQASLALRHLTEVGYLCCDRHTASGKPFRPKIVVYPTPLGLRTMPEYAKEPDEALAAQLAKLTGGTNGVCGVVRR